MKYFLLLLAFVGNVACAQGVANLQIVPLASAAQTAATVNSAAQINYTFRGAHFVVNVSAFTAGTYTPHIQAQDPVSLAWYDLLVGPAIGATGTTVLKVYPGIGVVANGAAADMLPQTWRVQLIGAGGQSMTISVAAYMGL